MKTIALLASGLLMFASSSMAQTCTTPTTLTSNATAVTGNTCTGGDQTLGNVCDNAQITGATAVYTWVNTGAAGSGNITVTPTGWDTAIFVGDGATCAAATAGFCDIKADAGGSGAAESVALSGLTNKTFYLFISSLAAANTCGAYSIATGTLPVKLQNFSVN
jgi:hypothetical protein